MIRSTLAAFAAAAALTAQGDPTAPRTPATAPEPLATIRATGIQQLLARWPETAVGRLAADPDVAAAADKAIAWRARAIARRRAVLAGAGELDLELEPWYHRGLYVTPDLWRAFAHPLRETRRIDFEAYGEDAKKPSFRFLLSCLPQFEGRWTLAFEQEAAALGGSPWFVEQPDAKVAGYAAHVFAPPRDLDDDASIASWMLHLPGTFVWGSGQTEGVTIEPLRDDGEPEVALRMNMQPYQAMFARMAGGMPAEFAALGFDKLRHLEWRGRFVGDRVLDEFEVELHGEPGGLVGALLGGKAKLPAQALPDGAIAQLRAAVDLTTLLTVIETATGGDVEIPAAVAKDIPAALDGGAAFGICAPAPGGLIPRMLLTLGVGDDEALDRVLTAALTGLPAKDVEYDGVPCKVITLDDVPQGLQPALCKRDGRLWIAESGRSLRAFLKAQRSGDEAMDVGDAPVPQGAGDVLPTFDLRFDEVALYRAYREIWLPLFALAAPLMGTAALAKDDMPPVDVVEEHCGTSRGVLRKDGDRYVVQHLGVLGGPELAALAMAWGPILTTEMQDHWVEQIARQIANHKVAEVWPAFEAFQQREQRWPNDLAELITAQELPDDALLLPGDDFAEDVTLADGRTVRSSFRYFPQPVVVQAAAGPANVILIEIRPQRYERVMLAANGALPDIYGDESRQPIERFRD